MTSRRQATRSGAPRLPRRGPGTTQPGQLEDADLEELRVMSSRQSWDKVTAFLSRMGRGGGPRLRRFVRSTLRLLGRAVRLWQTRLQVRVVAITLILGLVATSVVGAFLADQVSSRLSDGRQAQAESDSARAAQQFAERVATYTDASSVPVETYLAQNVNLIADSGGDFAGVLLLSSPREGVPDPFSYFTGDLPPSLVPEDLRAAVRQSPGQSLRAISMTGSRGQPVPGLMLGSQVQGPAGDRYELYFVVSLEREKGTLGSVQRVLAIGMVGLVALLGLNAWLVTRQVVTPVAEAAEVAGRLSQGNLDERMSPRGRDELATLAQSFNDMADSLQDTIEELNELSRVQRRFVSDVSHELRTPLTTIRMASDFLDDAKADFDPTLQRSVELMVTQIDRFESLLSDLLEISRIDAGAAVLDPENVDLVAMVRRVLENARPLIQAKGCPVELVAAEPEVTAEVDDRRIQRIIRNLVLNAVEHSEGRPVRIEVAADERAAAVLVVDHGIGLKPGDEIRVFDRFWRADPARARTTGGTGLGLSISLEDAHLHDGTLQAWGREGVGTRFLLAVPRVLGGSFVDPPLPLEPGGEG